MDLFKIKNELKPQKGLSLISEPLSNDDYFGRSVILLTEHSDKGSVGFVLNKKTDYILSDLFEDFSAENMVFQGGPVEPNSLHYIHTLTQIRHKVEIKEGLFWGGDFEQIKEMLNLGLIKEDQIQFFLGYSGWSSMQLEEELEKHFWIISEIDEKEIFLSRSKDFWKEKIKHLGEAYKVWLNVPENPSLN